MGNYKVGKKTLTFYDKTTEVPLLILEDNHIEILKDEQGNIEIIIDIPEHLAKEALKEIIKER